MRNDSPWSTLQDPTTAPYLTVAACFMNTALPVDSKPKRRRNATFYRHPAARTDHYARRRHGSR